MTTRRETIWLTAVLLGSVVFHAATIPGQSLFVDEVSELLHACDGSLADAAWRADSMPPTFSLMVRAAASVVGEGRAVRWVSVACALATIVVVWRLGRRLDSVIGLAAAAVFALLPMQLFYAQMIRGYALFTLAAALVIAAYLRAIESDSPRAWAAFAAAGVFGMWCHYYLAIALIVLLADLAVRRGIKIGKKPLLAGAAIVAGCLPLIPFLQADFAYQRDLRPPRYLTVGAAAYTGFSLVSGYTLGPSKPELQTISAREAAAKAIPGLIAVSLTVTPLVVLGVLRLGRNHAGATLLLLVIAPTLLIGAIGYATGITYNPRFVAWCVVPLAFLLGAGCVPGVGLAKRLRWIRIACVSGLLAVCLTAVANRHLVDRYRNEDLAAAAGWLASRVETGQPVYVVSDYMAAPLKAHFRLADADPPSIVRFPDPRANDAIVDDPTGAERAAAGVSSGGETFWLVETRPFHGDPDGFLLAAIAERSVLEEAAAFAGVTIWRGESR